MASEIADPHRVSDRRVHPAVGITARLDAERAAVDRAQKSIAHVDAVFQREPARADRVEDGCEDCDFDRARRMKPARRVVVEAEARQIVVDTHAECAVGERRLRLGDAGVQARRELADRGHIASLMRTSALSSQLSAARCQLSARA